MRYLKPKNSKKADRLRGEALVYSRNHTATLDKKTLKHFSIVLLQKFISRNYRKLSRVNRIFRNNIKRYEEYIAILLYDLYV